MATRKLTFTLPEDLARQFLKRVPARDRSRFVTEAIEGRFRERDEQLIRACEIANADPDVLALEQDFSSLPDEMTEPWTDAPAR